VVALVLVLSGGKNTPRAVPGVPAGAATPGASAGSAAPSASSTALANGTGAAVPAGWQAYRNPKFGWSIAVPPEFSRSGGAGVNQVDFRDNAGRLLRVEIAPKANASAIGDWRKYEPTFARQVSNYQRVRIDPADGADGVRAADWEFMFRDGGADLHVLNRGVIDGESAHALYWQTPDSSWTSSQQLRDQIFSTFQPPAQ
jgi:eukaryotic-like serine/threonine-protein kinase